MQITPSRRQALFLPIAVAMLPVVPAWADAGASDQPPPDSAGASPGDAPGKSAEIVVTAHALRDMGLMAGAVELDGEDLLRVSSPQIGDTLAKLPGVSATSFAPGASRPVLRGQSGDRVQVLIDGLGSIDLSSVSADHGVALDTLTVDHVDVLHGPALLAFGGQAIGGAVIAYDKRIPRHRPDGPFDLTALTSFQSVSDGKSASAGIDVPLGDKFVAHADASWHDSNDLRVGGQVLSAPLRAEVLALASDLRAGGDDAGASELEAGAAQAGRVPNSFARGTSFGAGVAFIDDGGTLGVSVQRIDNTYGVPGRPGAGEQGVSIDMGQTRFDLRGQLRIGGFFDALEIRGAYADYNHSELEEDGAVGTHFARTGIETRAELIQADHGGWKGRSGVQYSWGKLAVTGDEAILPDNSTDRLGLFTLQSLRLGPMELEAAGRIERVAVHANAARFDRQFTLRSAAAGVAYHPAERLKLGVNFAHGERAPSPEELLTDGAHVATQAYEIGDSSFGRERSNGFEAYLHYDTEPTALSLTAYRTDFKGFVTPIPTGETIEGFPVFQYRQLPARFQGFEAQASQRLAEWGGRSLTLDAAADYVRARLKGSGPAPRIPPLRVQGGLEYATPALTLRGEVEWNDAQQRVGPFENPTGAFTLVNASASWQPMGEDGALTVILSANNLFDALGRRAASFTRDFVPLPGRDIRVTAKVSL